MLKIRRFQRVICLMTKTSYRPTSTNSLNVENLKCHHLLKTALDSDYFVTGRSLHLSATLAKYNKKSTAGADSDDEDDVQETQFKDERDSKVVKTKVNSLRADLIVKSGLSMARNKIETIFYDSKIRVNGKKIAKKSVQLKVGDEIDVIKGFSSTNPSHLVVSRVIILAADEQEEDLSVHLRRYKTLLVENYAGANAFKTSGSSDHT